MKMMKKKNVRKTFLILPATENIDTKTVNFKVRYRISVAITLIYSFYVCLRR